MTFSRCAVCDRDLVPWFERQGRAVFRCRSCGHIQVPAGVAELDGGITIYEAEHADVFEGNGNIDYYLDEGTRRAAVAKAEFVRTFVPSGSLLDVGASYGHFLHAARDGFTAYGVELNPTAVEWSRQTFGVENFVGSLYAIPNTIPAPFDVVVAWDVIEHLDEPRRALKMLRSYLKPGGMLFLSSPDAGSLMSRVMGSRWVYQDPVQHVNLFSRANLTRLLDQNGFTVQAHTHFGRQYRLKYVFNRLEYLSQGRPTGVLIRPFTHLPDALLRKSITLKLWDVMGLVAKAVD
jgi:2-polyprenyl-3-methyl-5-hydroxy-6-metoxy-1,4-benzoquinol methylase